MMVSTADILSLEGLVKERNVDGILAGISEFNLLKAMELSDTFGLPFYCTRAQWDAVENKENFRKMCVENGVPCPRTYYMGEKISEEAWGGITFPAVIKPVDASASEGVYICRGVDEMRAMEDDARARSECGRIIVEEYVNGNEFTAHYTICDGEPTLSCIDNRYPASIHVGNVTTVPIARIYPSTFTDEYMSDVDSSMARLCRSLGLRDGVLFVQGIYARGSGFHIFEAGLRPAGEAAYRFLERINGVNFMHMIVEHALLGKNMTYRREREDPYMHGKCCGVVSFAAKGGRVAAIKGMEKAVSDTGSVIEYENRYPVGSITPDGDTLHQLMLRFVMAADSREDLADDISHLNETVSVLDEEGNNMVVKFDPSLLLDRREGGGNPG